MEKDSRDSRLSFSDYRNTLLTKYIMNYCPHLESDVYSEDSVHDWVARFQSGDTSCENSSRPGRPLTDLAEPFRLFLQNYPFASARVL
jgi:hypothetical protein